VAKALGLHIIADLYGVNGELIDRVEDIRALLEGAVKHAQLTKISSHYYQFKPHGATGVVLIAESHISIHTWPELGIATVDVYTCGDPQQCIDAMNYIIEKLNPSRVDKKVFERGLLEEHQKKTTEILKASVEA
jgi:S-adenosylmethionine decarboxylase